MPLDFRECRRGRLGASAAVEGVRVLSSCTEEDDEEVVMVGEVEADVADGSVLGGCEAMIRWALMLYHQTRRCECLFCKVDLDCVRYRRCSEYRQCLLSQTRSRCRRYLVPLLFGERERGGDQETGTWV